MHRMALCVGFVCLGTLTAAAAAPNTLTPEEIRDGWLLLFDGQSLYGWTTANPAHQACWSVKDGAIAASGGELGLLCTTTQFGDYQLAVDFRAPKGTNSGVFLRTPPSPKPAETKNRCYELNIAAPEISRFPTGSFVERLRCEGNYDSTDWQSYLVTAQGPHFVVQLNGQKVLDYTDPKPLGRGFIGLQNNIGPVEFRNLKLKPLGLASIFNGKDLTGWKTYPELKSECTVTPEGAIHLQHGRGQLESVGRYADFVLQLEVFVHAPGVNSGVFFRSIPGEVLNGYECQIENRFLEGDRTKPADCGTGGIFRRQNARKVVSNDQQWFQQTIVTAGPHFAVWVDGYQVTDWTDDRKPDPNPRKGLRREAGTIIFQGHDDTTDISFRNVRVGEIPSR